MKRFLVSILVLVPALCMGATFLNGVDQSVTSADVDSTVATATNGLDSSITVSNRADTLIVAPVQGEVQSWDTGAQAWSNAPPVVGTETDPVWVANSNLFYPAANPSNYINSFTETDPVWVANSNLFYPAANPSNYIASFTEVDPVFTAASNQFYLTTNPSNFVEVIINGGTSGSTGVIARTATDITITFPTPDVTKDNQELAASNIVTTTSGTFVSMPGTTITVTNSGLGIYQAWFRVRFDDSGPNNSHDVIIATNGIPLGLTLASHDGQGGGNVRPLSTHYRIPNLGNGDTISALFRTDGTFRARERSLMIKEE